MNETIDPRERRVANVARRAANADALAAATASRGTPSERASPALTRKPPSRASKETLRWARWLHVYTSMIALVVILFFGLTGITVNHPTWTFGDSVDTSVFEGTLPSAPVAADGTVDYLTISEYVRATYAVRGAVDSFDFVNNEVSIAYKNPGYSAEVFVDAATAQYKLTIEQQGWLAVMNDLHKGRDAGSSWRWLIDLSAGFLVVVAITGLVMQLVLRKRRTSALVSVGAGAVVLVLLVWLTLR